MNTKLASRPGIRSAAMSIALSIGIIGAGTPGADSGTLSRAITGTMGSLEMDIWLSPRTASIRNQVPVIEMTAINQIDQMPLRR